MDILSYAKTNRPLCIGFDSVTQGKPKLVMLFSINVQEPSPPSTCSFSNVHADTKHTITCEKKTSAVTNSQLP